MTSHIQGFRNLMVLTVATAPETTAALMRGVRARVWTLEETHSETHFSMSRRPSFSPQLRSAEACLAFVDFGKNVDEAVETTRYLLQVGGKVTVIAVANESNSSTILQAMRAGCSEFLAEPVFEAALNTLLEEIEKAGVKASKVLGRPGMMIALLGTKGGTGTTTMAVHLAIRMARRQGKRTLLIDHHARLGHAGVYLGVESGGYTFEEVMRNLPRLDSELLRRFVAKHPSGLELLTSPDAGHGFQNTEDDDLKDDAELIHRTLEFLRGEYDYIVVDCERTSFERNHPVFTASNWVYLVGTPEVAAIRDMARYIDELALMEDAVEKVRILINRWNTSYALPLDQIEQAIKQPIAVKVPTGYPEMVRAANLGEPISSQSAGEISDTFDRWINEIAGEGDPVKPTRERRRLTLWRNEAPAH